MDRAAWLFGGWLLAFTGAAIAQAPLAPEHRPVGPPQIRWVTPAPLPFDFAVHPERYLRPPDEARDPEAQERAKALAASGALPAAGKLLQPADVLSWSAGPAPRAPTPSLSRPGISASSWYPPDGNGAIGLTRYLEITNGAYALYGRGGGLVHRGTLDELTGDSGDMFDPVVLWDPGTRRFYYLITHNRGWTGSRSYYNFGYSRTGSPSGPQDFCNYQLDWGYGDAGWWVDFEKMGTTADFMVFAGDLFPFSGMFVRADAQWITKPPAGPACQDPSAFHLGIAPDLRHADGVQAYAVQPARQVDPRPTGWLVSANSGSGDALHLFKVRKNAQTGDAIIATTAVDVAIPAYEIPPDAPQPGTDRMLDTGGTALGISTTAVDPARGGVNALWTILPDLGFSAPNVPISTLQWFELDPLHATILQSGRIADPALHVFNGAIAPDRAVHGTSRAFGDAMIITFDTSSATSKVAIAAVSKIGDAAMSAATVLLQSRGTYGCAESICRWGDYSSATADPAADPTAPHGVVWATSMVPHATTIPISNDWIDRNFAIAP